MFKREDLKIDGNELFAKEYDGTELMKGVPHYNWVLVASVNPRKVKYVDIAMRVIMNAMSN